MALTGKKKRGGVPFQIYNTGCRGTVFLLCTLPGCGLGVDTAEEGAQEVVEEAMECLERRLRRRRGRRKLPRT